MGWGVECLRLLEGGEASAQMVLGMRQVAFEFAEFGIQQDDEGLAKMGSLQPAAVSFQRQPVAVYYAGWLRMGLLRGAAGRQQEAY